MSNDVLLGIDTGTSKINCTLFDLSARRIAGVEEKNETIEYPDGRIEQDMLLLWDKVCTALQRLFKESGVDVERIKAIGVTGQGEGCWLIGKDGKPVRNALLWCDGRAADSVRTIEKDELLLSRYQELTGSRPFSGAQIVILKCLNEHEPHILEKARHVLFCKDWIRYKLSGVAAIEYTDASTSILDLNRRTVVDPLFTALGIDRCRELVPDLIGSADIGGSVSAEASVLTGLRKDTPIVAGLMDIAATALGTGAVYPNDCCTILGTTSCNEVLTPDFSPDRNSAAGYEIDALNSGYLHVMASMAGTRNIDWYLETFLPEKVSAIGADRRGLFCYLEREMRKIGTGADGIIYHPYISPAGERSPFNDSNARAQFFGISSSSTRLHLLRAVYEGVAFSVRDNLEHGKKVEKIYLTGGGAKSRLWAEIISDVTGKTVYKTDDTNQAARGAALLAGYGTGIYRKLDEIVEQTVKDAVRIEPDKARHGIYNELFNMYLELRRQNTDLWEKRKQIVERIGTIV